MLRKGQFHCQYGYNNISEKVGHGDLLFVHQYKLTQVVRLQMLLKVCRCNGDNTCYKLLRQTGIQ